MGFTHGGRRLEEFDDFRDEMPLSSGDEDNFDQDEDLKRGKLNEEIVHRMNFGGGEFTQHQDEAGPKKTRKEVFEEIIAKSKAYKAASYELKQASHDLTNRLDDQF